MLVILRANNDYKNNNKLDTKYIFCEKTRYKKDNYKKKYLKKYFTRFKN